MRIPAHDKAAADARADASARSRRAREGQQRPSAAPPVSAALLALQRTMGNAVVTRMLASGRGSSHGHEDRLVQRSTALQVLRSPGQPLQEPLRAEMESRLGADFSDVRIHTDPLAQRSAAEVGARAYTSGNHVIITDGANDKHTLAHELTHVIQQRQGPVAGTDTGDGLRVSDPGDRFEREAEATAARVMAAHPPVQRAASETEGTPSTVSGAGTVVQRKGPEPLSSSLPAEAPRAEGLLGKWKALTRTQPDPNDALAARVRTAMAAYDSDPNRDPMHCLVALLGLQVEITPAEDTATGATQPFLTAARGAVEAELDLVKGQITRDDSLPPDARGPFRAMTDNGMLWNRQDWADSAAAFGMRGPSYFRELSELNRAGMTKEITGRGGQNWVPDVTAKLTTALGQSVLCHYTTRSRAEQMLGQGQMKSKTELLSENPYAPNNSEPYDKHVLANEGFVFFFLEVPGSPFRETRFGGEEPARIEIPLAASPLMTQGWLMLSDFAQREYPTLRAKPQDPAQTQSKLATREETFSPEFSLPVRKFDVGARGAEMDFGKLAEEMENEQNPERRGQIPYAMTQAASDPHSAMTYGAPGPQAQVHAERLRSNTLMGSDIVPGLVERAIVEIQRLGDVNPQLAAALKAMSGDDLMKFLLKDLLRPQAMLPNSVNLSSARMVLDSGQQVPATAS
ncbi:DUF4157 domain-containing protein [Streptantibioticus ferralitis]|uniref:eCIS core domain-containing protein n=1 Tax=Streptantibioticus ferralitis TaxID=236510 RepID=UPI003378C5E8